MRQSLQHRCDALHVMPRLVSVGLSLPRARFLAHAWEALTHRWLYASTRRTPAGAGGPSRQATECRMYCISYLLREVS